ncbi:hypothetical protein [Variovorax sp. RO1]|uniref:hypothetical protein n=1 Tax=Variovorax sp. RO1 TaxID=2066034 RepID=UPI0015DECE3F|nr:hypothetical protein [Variovorax sp. RO1]
MTGFGFLCLVVVFMALPALLLMLGGAVERAAQRGERIFKARRRDHSTVPKITWKDSA